MSSRVRCPGCSSLFTLSGYTRHLASSKDPRCVTIRTEREAWFPGIFEDEPVGSSKEDESAGDPSVSETSASHDRVFEGDYFGSASEYREQDFGWDEEDSESEFDSSDSEDVLDAQSQVSHDRSPEADQNSSSDISSSPSPEPMDEDDSADDELTAEHIQQVRERSERLRQRPAVIVKFGGRAGCVIEAPKNAQHQYGNASYQSSLGAASTNNPWYPFQSKLDWEVGKWAKLRGPGDTSFSELLAIEGVSRRLCYNASSTDHHHHAGARITEPVIQKC